MEIVFYENHYNSIGKIHNQNGLSHCHKKCKNYSSADSTDSESKKHRKLCFDHGLCFEKVPEKSFVRFNKHVCENVVFLTFAYFEVIKEKDQTLKGKVTTAFINKCLVYFSFIRGVN